MAMEFGTSHLFEVTDLFLLLVNIRYFQSRCYRSPNTLVDLFGVYGRELPFRVCAHLPSLNVTAHLQQKGIRTGTNRLGEFSQFVCKITFFPPNEGPGQSIMMKSTGSVHRCIR